MKEFWNTLQLVFAAVGGWLGYFLGGCDGLLYRAADLCHLRLHHRCHGRISDKKLSSAVGFRGICRKVLIFILVGIANVIDINVLGQVGVLRTAVIFFYISNEGLSLIENAAHLGLPIPGKLKEVLEQLHNRDEKDTDKEEK
jgi:toxin secretion/phage lysis holin